MSAPFDPEEIMKEVRAAANLSPPAKTANLLKSAEAGASDFSRLAALAASQDLAKAFEAGKSSPQVEIEQIDNHGVRPAKLPEISSFSGSRPRELLWPLVFRLRSACALRIRGALAARRDRAMVLRRPSARNREGVNDGH